MSSQLTSEYSTDIFFSLNDIKKRQNEGKDKFDKFVLYLDNVGTDVDKIQKKLNTDVKEKYRGLSQDLKT